MSGANSRGEENTSDTFSKQYDLPESSSLPKKLFLYGTGPLFGFIAFIATNKGFGLEQQSIAPLIWTLIAYIVGQHIANIFDDELIGRNYLNNAKLISPPKAFENILHLD